MPRLPAKHGAAGARGGSALPPAPHVAIADAYAADVAAGRILACKWVRLACARYGRDRAREADAAWPYRLDLAKAERVCRFVELLPHTKGKWAAQRQLLKLEPWQVWILVTVFGFVRKKDGLRRFRKSVKVVPRKNGKSALSAPVGLYMLAADGEFGAEVYSGATTEKQAWEVFRPARLMAQATPELLAQFGIQVNASNIHILANGSRFEALIGKPGDGSSPSCAIIDEYHEHDTPDQHDTMLTGMGAREQPLMWIITTAGDNLAGPCYDELLTGRKVLEGVLEDEELFFVEYTIDAEAYSFTLQPLPALLKLEQDCSCGCVPTIQVRRLWREACASLATRDGGRRLLHIAALSTQSGPSGHGECAGPATSNGSWTATQSESVGLLSEEPSGHLGTERRSPTQRSDGGRSRPQKPGCSVSACRPSMGSLPSSMTPSSPDRTGGVQSARSDLSGSAWIIATAQEAFGASFAGAMTEPG